MKDYYQILELSPSASDDEVRKAYKTLARKYHPDVNPGEASEERFKGIKEAYDVLADPKSRKSYDADLKRHKRELADARVKAYRRTQEASTGQSNFTSSAEFAAKQDADRDAVKKLRESEETIRRSAALRQDAGGSNADSFVDKLKRKIATLLNLPGADAGGVSGARPGGTTAEGITKISIIEVPVSMAEAISGVKKTVEIEEPDTTRKINVRVPPGVRTGSLVRLRASSRPGEEVVLIIRVAAHPILSIDQKGLVIEIPITVNEAISGASVSIPGLEDQVLVKVPPGSQTGDEIKVKGKGIQGEAGPGDLFVRLAVKVPESEHAVGIKEKAALLDLYYESPVRSKLPSSIKDFLKNG